MELLKTEHSKDKGNGKLDKVLIKCDEPNYYKLNEMLYVSQNEQALIIKALYDYNINIVLKFGILESIRKEYLISLELLDLPNFIRYFCMFVCDDNIKNIINNKQTISNYKMCHYGDKSIGIIVMKEYNLGSIENYDWNELNFDLLKNIIKQVLFAIIHAYKTKGFIHGDLHSGNVLLKPKKTDFINYGGKILFIDNLEAIIMDFEKSKFGRDNKSVELLRNIDKLFTSIINSNNMKININYDRNRLIKLKSVFLENTDYINEIENIINDMNFYSQ